MNERQDSRVALSRILYAAAVFLILVVVSNSLAGVPGVLSPVMPGLSILTVVRTIISVVAVIVLLRTVEDARALLRSYSRHWERQSLGPSYSPVISRLIDRGVFLLYAVLVYTVLYPAVGALSGGLPEAGWVMPVVTGAFILLMAVQLYGVFQDFRQLADRFAERGWETGNLSDRVVCSSCGIRLEAGSKQCPVCGNVMAPDIDRPEGTSAGD